MINVFWRILRHTYAIQIEIQYVCIVCLVSRIQFLGIRFGSVGSNLNRKKNQQIMNIFPSDWRMVFMLVFGMTRIWNRESSWAKLHLIAFVIFFSSSMGFVTAFCFRILKVLQIFLLIHYVVNGEPLEDWRAWRKRSFYDLVFLILRVPEYQRERKICLAF